jgi:hypothetical protein
MVNVPKGVLSLLNSYLGECFNLSLFFLLFNFLCDYSSLEDYLLN